MNPIAAEPTLKSPKMATTQHTRDLENSQEDVWIILSSPSTWFRKGGVATTIKSANSPNQSMPKSVQTKHGITEKGPQKPNA